MWENNIKMDLKKEGGKLWSGCIWLIRLGTGCYEHVNKPTDSIKGRKFLD
jgi:hypothetical protein